MKYIKKFENIEEDLKNMKYQADDYVLLDIDKIIDNNSKNNETIVPFKYVQIRYVKPNIRYSYRVDFDSKDNNGVCWVNEDEIIRKLTPEEIEECEMIKNANKYNL